MQRKAAQLATIPEGSLQCTAAQHALAGSARIGCCFLLRLASRRSLHPMVLSMQSMQQTKHGILLAAREGATFQPAQLLLDRYRSKCCWMADKDHQQMNTELYLKLSKIAAQAGALAAADNLLRSCRWLMSSGAISRSSLHLPLPPSAYSLSWLTTTPAREQVRPDAIRRSTSSGWNPRNFCYTSERNAVSP